MLFRSPNPSKDFSSMEREDPADENIIPPTAHLFPKYFSQIDHQHVYDPFRLSVPDSPNTTLGSSTGVDIVQKKIPESTEDDILDLVENWNDENSDESPAAHSPPAPEAFPASHLSPSHPESNEEDIMDLVENWNDDKNSDQYLAAHISPASKFYLGLCHLFTPSQSIQNNKTLGWFCEPL